jgi:hypothetical protein
MPRNYDPSPTALKIQIKLSKDSNIFETLSQIFGFFYLFVNRIRMRKVSYDLDHVKDSHMAASGDT